jgi:putative transposase
MFPKPLPQRKTPRLQGYDYSHSGAYFITFCTFGQIHHFGDIASGTLNLNPLGQLAYQELSKLPHYWKTIDIDLFVVMPNHVHLIVVLHEKTPATRRIPSTSDIVRNYKSGVTRIARIQKLIDPYSRLWQGRYHDHIIRNERDLKYIRNYIATNPERWSEDKFYTLK